MCDTIHDLILKFSNNYLFNCMSSVVDEVWESLASMTLHDTFVIIPEYAVFLQMYT